MLPIMEPTLSVLPSVAEAVGHRSKRCRASSTRFVEEQMYTRTCSWHATAFNR